LSKISFGKPKPQTMGCVVNLFYKSGDVNGYLQIQTPLMNTFGISKDEKYGKYSMGLSFYENSPNEEFNRLNTQFRENMEKLEDKIIHDIASKYYKEWPIGGDAWESFPLEVRIAMVKSKLGKQKLVRSNVKDGNVYKTLNLKVGIKNDKDGNPTDEFKMETFMLDNDSRIIRDAQGNNKLFDTKDLLLNLVQQKKVRPKVICLFQMTIWIVNTNIFMSPQIVQCVVEPPKAMSMKAVFNEKGIMKSQTITEGVSTDNNSNDDDNDDNDDNDDDDMPVGYNQ